MYVCMCVCIGACVHICTSNYFFTLDVYLSIYLPYIWQEASDTHTPPPPPTAKLRPSYRPFRIRATSRPHAPTAGSMRAPVLNRVEQQRPTHRAPVQRGVGGHSGCSNRRGSALRAPPPLRLPRLAFSAENQVAAAKDDEEEDLGFERHAPAAPLRLHAVQHHDEAQQVQHVCRQPEDVHRAARSSRSHALNRNH